MMMSERELGPIYGWQWRNFGAKYVAHNKAPEGRGIDQLHELVQTLKTDPDNRRLIVSAWNPTDLSRMALPPCHYSFQVTVINGALNLLWNQRSVDVALGLPFNIASYGLLLHLLAKEAGLGEGRLIGFLGDVHIYVNHIDGIRQQLERSPKPLPKIKTEKFTSIFDWQYGDSVVEGYDPHPAIKFEIAV
jgi:thymidylate synthase